MKRILPLHLILIALMAITISTSSAQDTISSLNSQPALAAKPKNPNSFWRRLSVGGQLGFQFGSITSIVIAPEARLRAIDQLYVGLRGIYQYSYFGNCLLDTKTNEIVGFSSNMFGGGLYLRYYLRSLFNNALGNIFAHVEYEYLKYTFPFEQTTNPPAYIEDLRFWDVYYIPGKSFQEYNSFFIGGGYSQPVGGRVFLDLLVLFNINDTRNSPYTNPIIRIGVGVGL